VPDAFQLICDIRVLPGQTIQYVTDELEKLLSDIEGCKVSVRGTTNPSASPSDDGFLKAIRRSLVKVTESNVSRSQRH